VIRRAGRGDPASSRTEPVECRADAQADPHYGTRRGADRSSLALTTCGGDDDDEPIATTPTATTGATGATGAEDAGDGASYDITAQEYLDAAIPDQAQAVEDYVADNPDECGNADPKPGGDFQVGVAIAAAQASPDTALAEVIAGECQEEG
jgi:hypothetical protein